MEVYKTILSAGRNNSAISGNHVIEFPLYKKLLYCQVWNDIKELLPPILSCWPMTAMAAFTVVDFPETGYL